MKKILLYQHQSSYNHGCEALAYSISKIIKELIPDCTITLSSYYANEDKEFDFPFIDSIVQNNAWLKRGTVPYFIYQIDKRTFKSKMIQDMFMYCKTCYELAKENDICIAIGGDNYCYNKGKEHWALDRKIKKLGKITMLWGCSIEPDDIPGELAEHLSNFDIITARDPITYQALIDHNVRSKIYRCADPAFILPIEECRLPKEWEKGNMIGLNFSPMVMGEMRDKDTPRKAIDELVRYILKETNQNIVLIPHVRLSFNDDIDELRIILKKYESTNRVILIDNKKLNARQLKYIISNCKMFIGARTHATIAAYSTNTPTLSIGYSIKAKGIARDLFGNEEGMTVSIKEIGGSNKLIESFRNIYDHLEENSNHLRKTIPDCKMKAYVPAKALQSLLEVK